MLSAKPWRPEAVCFLIAAQILCIGLGVVARGLLQKEGVAGFKNDYDFGFLFLVTFSFQGMTWILMERFFWAHDLSLLEGIGVKKRESAPYGFLLALGLVIVILPIAYLLQMASTALMEKIHWIPKDEEAVKLLTGATSPAAQVYLRLFLRLSWFRWRRNLSFAVYCFHLSSRRGFPSRRGSASACFSR